MINLIDGYVVDVDPLNWTLKKETGKSDKKGNPLYRTFSYHGSLKQAVQACVSLIQKEELNEGTYSLLEAVNTLNESQKRFEDLLEQAVKEMEE